MQLDLKKKSWLKKAWPESLKSINSFMSEGFKFEILTSLKKQF